MKCLDYKPIAIRQTDWRTTSNWRGDVEHKQSSRMERKQLLLCLFIEHVKQRRPRSITSWQWNKVLTAKCECTSVYTPKVDKYKPLHHRISGCVRLDSKRERNGCMSLTLMTKSRIRIFRLHVWLFLFSFFFFSFRFFFIEQSFLYVWAITNHQTDFSRHFNLPSFITPNTIFLIVKHQPLIDCHWDCSSETIHQVLRISISMYLGARKIEISFWSYRSSPIPLTPSSSVLLLLIYKGQGHFTCVLSLSNVKHETCVEKSRKGRKSCFYGGVNFSAFDTSAQLFYFAREI